MLSVEQWSLDMRSDEQATLQFRRQKRLTPVNSASLAASWSWNRFCPSIGRAPRKNRATDHTHTAPARKRVVISVRAGMVSQIAANRNFSPIWFSVMI
jgi:hypothetical protein